MLTTYYHVNEETSNLIRIEEHILWHVKQLVQVNTTVGELTESTLLFLNIFYLNNDKDHKNLLKITVLCLFTQQINEKY